MKKIAPIVLIWLAVSFAIMTLLSNLGILGAQYSKFFLIGTGVVFTSAAVLTWVSFLKISHIILEGIKNWDVDLQRDIPSFIQKRKVRMITIFSMLLLLYSIQFLIPHMSEKQLMGESLLYVIIIGFFHCALVTTLVMFKMQRTLSWVQYENHLSKTEES